MEPLPPMFEMRNGGGKNAQHKRQAAREAAKKKWEAAKQAAEKCRRDNATRQTKETKAEQEKLDKAVKHWKNKMDETGENHSQVSKGNAVSPTFWQKFKNWFTAPAPPSHHWEA